MKIDQITYTEIHGIKYPNLYLPEQPTINIGKYGQMRLDFLKKHRRGTYTLLLTECRLSEHLSAIGLVWICIRGQNVVSYALAG